MNNVKELLAWLDTRAKWLHHEMCNGGDLQHLQARYAECRCIRETIPMYVTPDSSVPDEGARHE